jgi:nucleoside-diphosphate-sugar epimerase
MAASLPPLVLTGATGFVGWRVVERLRDEHSRSSTSHRRVTLLLRDAASMSQEQLPPSWRIVACDLAREVPAANAISPGSVVVHLAAATGRLAPAIMREVNVGGTRRLVDACVAAGAAHLVFVSSIAAAFEDRRWYHYAEAKRDAERVVAASGLASTIVRPTMVFGPGSPVQQGLEHLALGGAPIVLGSGRVEVQPIHVDDLARLLLALSENPPPESVVLEVGGPLRLTMRALLARMRRTHALPARAPWSVPLALPRHALAIAERVIGARLPVTAGQLASFVNDSTAQPNALVERYMHSMRTLGDMLDGTAPSPDVADSVASFDPAPYALGDARALTHAERDALTREFAVFASYLGSSNTAPRAAASYARSHVSVAPPTDAFDRWLVTVARRSATACSLADAYARFSRPYGALRRKLVLALAVLESSPAVHRDYDTANPSGRLFAWAAIAGAGLGWIARSVLAALLLAPLQLAARFASDDGSEVARRG